MSQPGPSRDQTDDLSWARSALETRCWHCGRPQPGGHAILGSQSLSGGETQIPVCRAGTGCQDGRTYHGPPYLPHWPGEHCPICDRPSSSGRTSTGRRMAANAARRPGTVDNRRDRHR